LILLGLSILPTCDTFAQEKRKQTPPPTKSIDVAEVESVRNFPPEDDLVLDEDGVNKRKALALYYRGIYLQKTENDAPAALEIFKEVIKLDPANVSLAMETAQLCAVYGEFSQALEVLEDSLEANPSDPDAYLNISRYCDKYHNDDAEIKAKALSYSTQALEKFPQDYAVLEHGVLILLSLEKQTEAEELLNAALEKDIKDGDYWIAMGAIAQSVWPMRKKENRDRIVKIYEKALVADPENLETAEKVARFHRQSGNLERSIQIYEILVRRSPDLLEARQALAELYWASGREDDAISGLEALVRIDPEAAEVRRSLTALYIAQNKLDAAMKHTEQILSQGVAEVDDYLMMADLQLKSKKIGGALQTLRDGSLVFPESPHVGQALAKVYSYLERYEESFSAYRIAEQLSRASYPKLLSEEFYFEYAIAAERSKNFEKAAELFKKSIELVPEDSDKFAEKKAQALNYLGYMWLEREENIDEAGKLIQEANELLPDNAAYLDSLGWYYFLKEDYEPAVKNLLRAAELMEDEPDSVIFEHLARAYFGKGDLKLANDYLKKAILLDPDRADDWRKLKKSFQEKSGDSE